MGNITYVSWELIGNFMERAFEAVGVPADEAKICADVLMESDRRGIESHGCNRFKTIYIDRIKEGIQSPVTLFEVIKETATTAVVDGHDGMGMVAARNSTHYGIAGYYAMMAAKQNMIGITGTNARPSIAPTFGVENMIGTNPITFAMPTDEDFPFVLDCATSITQRGKIEYYARNGMETPRGAVIDQDGFPMTNSKQILSDLTSGKAALAPLGGIGEDTGGHKGYGYATVVEILSAALQAGSFLRMLNGTNEDGGKIPYHLGHFFIAIDTEAFLGAEEFKHTAGEILRELRSSKKAKNQDRIYTAGEKEYLSWLERKDKGVPLGISVQKDLVKVRDELNINITFPFE
ncbi:Ldh family oxidoreductase [Sedimentibacter saalensis]|uniref:Ldh family oxidoreductase n=1 Tax=Sedimentibacter saalensis TaxID=130788 RepID=UPI0028999B62|nr:Ldh family oxidoreductase [Sedimentibacter saalensis]